MPPNPGGHKTAPLQGVKGEEQDCKWFVCTVARVLLKKPTEIALHETAAGQHMGNDGVTINFMLTRVLSSLSTTASLLNLWSHFPQFRHLHLYGACKNHTEEAEFRSGQKSKRSAVGKPWLER